MLKNMMISLAAAVAMAGGAMSLSAPAHAQVGFEVGPGGPRVTVDRPERRIVERRVDRRVVVEDDDEEVCRTEIRRRVNRAGEVVTRRERICE